MKGPNRLCRVRRRRGSSSMQRPLIVRCFCISCSSDAFVAATDSDDRSRMSRRPQRSFNIADVIESNTDE